MTIATFLAEVRAVLPITDDQAEEMLADMYGPMWPGMVSDARALELRPLHYVLMLDGLAPA